MYRQTQSGTGLSQGGRNPGILHLVDSTPTFLDSKIPFLCIWPFWNDQCGLGKLGWEWDRVEVDPCLLPQGSISGPRHDIVKILTGSQVFVTMN